MKTTLANYNNNNRHVVQRSSLQDVTAPVSASPLPLTTGTRIDSHYRMFSSSPALVGKEKVVDYPSISKTDFGDFQEYSVIHTNRSLNLMSLPFRQVMQDLNSLLKYAYNAYKTAIIPGSGTYGMEAVARQFATNEHVIVIRNGWFSYRWTEIFEMGQIPRSHTVLMAQPVPMTVDDDDQNEENNNHPHLTHFAPYPIEKVVQKIEEEKPAVIFAPHVETSTGIMLPDDFIRAASNAIHQHDGLFVLDCIASGTVWCDMKSLGVDVLITAPQKGWSGPPCCAIVQLSERAYEKMINQQGQNDTSFSLSLKRWCAIMDTYEKGGFAYHTTMPTDALRDFHEITVETLRHGLPELKQSQLLLGQQAHELMEKKYGLKSVSLPDYRAPSVLVYYSPEQSIANPHMMELFQKHANVQIAMGVPWSINEPEDLKTFRIGLFGLDKLQNMDSTIDTMDNAFSLVFDDDKAGTTVTDNSNSRNDTEKAV